MALPPKIFCLKLLNSMRNAKKFFGGNVANQKSTTLPRPDDSGHCYAGLMIFASHITSHSTFMKRIIFAILFYLLVLFVYNFFTSLVCVSSLWLKSAHCQILCYPSCLSYLLPIFGTNSFEIFYYRVLTKGRLLIRRYMANSHLGTSC